MTYIVSSGALNSTHLLTYFTQPLEIVLLMKPKGKWTYIYQSAPNFRGVS